MITTQVSSISYVADGVVTEFPVPFQYLEPEFLVVQLLIDNAWVTQVKDLHYTVDEEETPGVYGTIVFVNPPADTVEVSIGRSIPVTQETDLQKSDRFDPEVVERMADKLTLLIQQNEAANALTVRFPDGEPTPITNTLPAKPLRPNTVLGFDESGNLRLYTLGELVDGTLGDADAFSVVEVAGNFTVTSGHRNRTIHSTDTGVPQAQNVITLPDPTTMPVGFFMSVVKAATADVLFQSASTIKAEVDPAELRRANAGVVLYIKNNEWWIVGAFGDSLPAPATNVYVTENSGIYRNAAAPVSPYVGQPWIDTDEDNALKIWDGAVWQLSTPLVKHALFVANEKPVRKVVALPALPDADWPVDSVALYSGQLWANVADVWTNTAISSNTILYAGASVINAADSTRPAPAVGSAFYQYSAITSAEQILNTDTPFTHDDLIVFNWRNGSAAKINNRLLSNPTRFDVTMQYKPVVGAGASAQLWLAYRTRPTEAGAWTAWTKLGDQQKPVNESGHDQVQEDLQWSGSIATPEYTDVQFGFISNRSGGSVDLSSSRMQALVFNL